MDKHNAQQQGDISPARKAFPLIGAIIVSWVVFQTLGDGLHNQPGAVDVESLRETDSADPATTIPATPEPDSSSGDVGFPAMPSP